jgi:hypothetical protein
MIMDWAKVTSTSLTVAVPADAAVDGLVPP